MFKNKAKASDKKKDTSPKKKNIFDEIDDSNDTKMNREEREEAEKEVSEFLK